MGDESRISSRVRQLLAQVLDVPPDSIGPGFSADSTGGWTSLNHLMLVSQLESEFEVVFSNQEIGELTSFTAISEALGRRLDAGT